MGEKLVLASFPGASAIPNLSREGKPRDKGLTFAVDDLLLDKPTSLRSERYVDWVKIGQSLPLLLERSKAHRENTALPRLWNQGAERRDADPGRVQETDSLRSWKSCEQ